MLPILFTLSNLESNCRSHAICQWSAFDYLTVHDRVASFRVQLRIPNRMNLPALPQTYLQAFLINHFSALQGRQHILDCLFSHKASCFHCS